jgi:pyrimidine-specific ribonucleoside hydrolase
MKRKIIFDCDPGHDDAIALLMAFASPKLDILAVTVTGGNQTLAKTLNNTKRVLSFAGVECLIAAGCDKPLFRELEIAPEVHGESGLDGPVLPESNLPVDERHAVEVMRELLEQSSDPITLVATGPLTNVGLLLSTYPHVKSKIDLIAIMGGSIVGGNWTSGAEFNILVDPEAAHIVFHSGIHIAMAGLDVTHRAMVTKQDTERIRSLNKKVPIMVAELLDFFALFHHTMGFVSTPLHDPVTIAYLIDPSIMTTKEYYVDIDVDGEFTLGATVADQLGALNKPANSTVMLDINREKFIDMIVNLVSTYE